MHDTDHDELAPHPLTSGQWLTEVPPFQPIPGAPDWFNLGLESQDSRYREYQEAMRRDVARSYDRGFRHHEVRLAKLERGQRRHANRLRLLEALRLHGPMISILFSTVALAVALTLLAIVK